MVNENLDVTPLMEWLLGGGWGSGVLWQTQGFIVLMIVLVGGGLISLLVLRKTTAPPGPTLSTVVGSMFGGLSLVLLTAVGLCATERTRTFLKEDFADRVFSTLAPLLGDKWSDGALYTWLAVAIGLTGVIYTCAWLITVLVSGPAIGTRQCGRAVIDIVLDIARVSPGRVLALAWLAVRESIRRRVVVVFFVFVGLILCGALFIDKTSAHPALLYIQIVMNFTVYLTMLFALILSSLSLPADIRERTLHTVVTKPVQKIEVVLGRVLGFIFVGTVLLALIGLISYVFVERSPYHTHELKPDMLNYTEVLPGNGGILRRGMTTVSHGHAHEVTIIERPGEMPSATVDMQKDHTHELYVSGSGTATKYTVGPPVGLFQARVPIYARKLSFLDERGQKKDKGINVGDEWMYRSFIKGQTAAEAIWSFEGLSADMFPESTFPNGIPIEMTLEVFRTYKGNQEKGVAGSISLRNPDPNAPKRVILRSFLAKKFAVDRQLIPRSFITAGADGKAETIHLFPCFEFTGTSLDSLRGAVPAELLAKLGPLKGKVFESSREFAAELATALNSAALGKAELEKYEELLLGKAKQPGIVSDDGRLDIIIQCMERNQCYGMAQPDLYIRASDSPFAWNFAKGYLGIWLQMVLVIALGVMFSTFLSGPVALLTTLFAIIVGLSSTYVGELAGGKVVGGGPFEAFQRMVTQANQTSELEKGAKTNAIKAMDAVAATMLRYFSAVVPGIGENDFADHVADGFDVGGELATRCLLCVFAYCLPVILLGYLCLKNREVAQ
jgi:ABC-type transport system involved in multi-copper enzyme maturation permease subunit